MRLASAMLLTVLVAPPALAGGATPRGDRVTPVRPKRTAMVQLPAGTYRPLFARAGHATERVDAFALDREPVTRGDYLAFVRTHPEWRRSAIDARRADPAAYLIEWRSDFDAGTAMDLRRPVTSVSRHAAGAYCAAQGKRLPTVGEWEYAASASATTADATHDARFTQHLVSLYARRRQPVPPVDAAEVNAFGVRGLHDLAWEWVAGEDTLAPSAHTAARHHARERAHERGHNLACASASIGASDASNYPAFLRDAIRAGASGRTSLQTLGFRCAA